MTTALSSAVMPFAIQAVKGTHVLGRIRKAMEEREAGFTLIELLVVIIIIGVLAAISIPIFLPQRKKGYEPSMRSDARNVANKFETYSPAAGPSPPIFTATPGPLTIGS